ncbi:G-type lectin S-receptor-like serine/threonine-protein kinase, partial [Trifolium medium]|nr:G-type lectin S-receptor-like serine/threonine-protein kinase [Trifolium medium]
DDDPAEGEYAMKLDLRGYPQIVTFKGSDIDTRAGPWLGEFIAGSQGPTPGATQRFMFNEKEVYYEYESNERQVYSNGKDECEDYAYCGTN